MFLLVVCLLCVCNVFVVCLLCVCCVFVVCLLCVCCVFVVECRGAKHLYCFRSERTTVRGTPLTDNNTAAT